MEVDTGVFEALTGQAAAAGQLAGELAGLGRKITALTGRVTALGKDVTAAGERVEQATTMAQIMRNAGVHEAEYEQMLASARSARKGRHARDRHGLRGIDGGKR